MAQIEGISRALDVPCEFNDLCENVAQFRVEKDENVIHVCNMHLHEMFEFVERPIICKNE